MPIVALIGGLVAIPGSIYVGGFALSQHERGARIMGWLLIVCSSAVAGFYLLLLWNGLTR